MFWFNFVGQISHWEGGTTGMPAKFMEACGTKVQK